jgi:hypothetical protein
LLISIFLSFQPERLADFIGDLRPAGSYILQFSLAHDGELVPDTAARAPRPDARENALDKGERRA